MRLTPHRVMITDLMHFSRKLPSIPVQRRMKLAAVVRARAESRLRPSWCAIFVKTFAMVAADRPELRRSYLTLPWAHLYEAYDSVASVAVERFDGDGRTLSFARLPSPDRHRLGATDRYIKHVANSRQTSSWIARSGLIVSRLPWPIRRSSGGIA